MSPRTKIILSLVGVFIFGGLTGAVITLGSVKRIAKERGMIPIESFERRQHSVLRQLDLSPEQRREIFRVIRELGGELRKDAHGFRERTQSGMREADARIQKILTDEQREKFLELRKKQHEETQKRIEKRGERREGGKPPALEGGLPSPEENPPPMPPPQ